MQSTLHVVTVIAGAIAVFSSAITYKPAYQSYPNLVPDEVAPETYDIPATLVRKLESALRSLNVLVVQSEAPANNGETRSIRSDVWLLDLDRAPREMAESLENVSNGPFSEVYPDQSSDTTSTLSYSI